MEVQVVNTHLGLFGPERLAQAEALLGPDWLGSPACREPVILAGDLNASSRSRPYKRLLTRLRDAQLGAPDPRPQATFHSRMPLAAHRPPSRQPRDRGSGRRPGPHGLDAPGLGSPAARGGPAPAGGGSGRCPARAGPGPLAVGRARPCPKEEGPPLRGSPSIVSPRSNSARTALLGRRSLRGADLTRGEDPGHGSRGPRQTTMRHWITSFRLLTTEAM